jgi:hypothetical protein
MSSQETTDNFWKVWNSFTWPEPTVVEYRLYYHADGSPKIYTMESLEGDYITVSQEVYVTAPENVKVVNGELTFLPKPVQHMQLVPNADSGTLCHTQDVCVVINQGPGIKWNIK